MRNLLALFGLAVLGFGGVGWYMGWYKLNVAKNTDGNLQITADVDTKKVSTDSSEIFKNVGAVIGNHVDKAAQDAKTAAPQTAPGGTPGPVVAPTQTPNIKLPELPAVPGTAPAFPPASNQGPIPLIPPKPM
ncbi:hypothetical protein R5W23_004938 [Gemmata sp. JC673]|uniref:Uncharacterized protein n=1 Tax=Gemmata algarum TaxID=2975278 RepID=A0ABU5F841_9BACT|nr:hypothetical protein [Gemmata algarum]MDY3563435.1 hypothetical protein [Gemmata algarum]